MVIRIGVIGYGYWGPNLVRNIQELPDSAVAGVCDLQPDRLEQVARRYPGVATTDDYRALIDDPKVDAVAIAVPVFRHFELAMAALEAGKHVLITKPMTARADEAQRLIEVADQRGLTLMVDHTFVYTGAVRKMREIIDADGIGDLYYYDSVRVNLGLFQSDVDVIWDLAPHDLSILDHLLKVQPGMVSATGMGHVAQRPENIAYLTLFFEQRLIAHIHVNWLAPVKVRRTLIGGSKKMIVYDDLEPSEKVKIYDKGLVFGDEDEDRYTHLIGYRTGDLWCPKLDMTEALETEVNHFVACIEQSARPLSDGLAGLRVVRVLEAAQQSMRANGRPVEL